MLMARPRLPMAIKCDRRCDIPSAKPAAESARAIRGVLAATSTGIEEPTSKPSRLTISNPNGTRTNTIAHRACGRYLSKTKRLSGALSILGAISADLATSGVVAYYSTLNCALQAPGRVGLAARIQKADLRR